MKNEKGQSTIEFILTFSLSVGFIFLFLKMAMNYTNGFMVHHATYMAARAYLVNDQERQGADENDARALEYAKQVFEDYMPAGLVRGVTQSSIRSSGIRTGALAIFTGIYADFTQTFSAGFIGGNGTIPFRSEAFLGREPTRFESIQQTCQIIKDIFTLSTCDVHVTLDDNGG